MAGRSKNPEYDENFLSWLDLWYIHGELIKLKVGGTLGDEKERFLADSKKKKFSSVL